MRELSRIAGLLIVLGALTLYLNRRAATAPHAEPTSGPVFMCEHQPKTLDGDGIALRLIDCEPLEVTGSGNIVDIEGTTHVQIDGDRNLIRWAGKTAPLVTDRGHDNHIEPQ